MVATTSTPKQLAALQLAASYANLLPNSDCQTKPHMNIMMTKFTSYMHKQQLFPPFLLEFCRFLSLVREGAGTQG